MTLYIHELKRGRLSLCIWTAAISFMLSICVLIYPEMSTQMGDVSKIFSDMGDFSAAFGMDQLNFGEFMGYFSIECGNVLGIGGALFAAILSIGSLAKEQKDGTAEFLLTHPVSRSRIITQKGCALITQITLLNLVVAGVTLLATAAVDVTVDYKILLLLFLAYYLLQLQIAAVTFGLSAIIKGNGLGIGLGLALLFYFMNIVANLTEQAEFLKYVTPFGYADGAYVIKQAALQGEILAVGGVMALAGVLTAYRVYSEKDIT